MVGVYLLCMGKKEGIELGSKLGLTLVMVDASYEITVTPETKALLNIANPSFTLEN
jgi:hypothetical protein